MTYFPLLLDHTALLPNRTDIGIAFTQVSKELRQQDTKNNAEI